MKNLPGGLRKGEIADLSLKSRGRKISRTYFLACKALGKGEKEKGVLESFSSSEKRLGDPLFEGRTQKERSTPFLQQLPGGGRERGL